MIKQSDIKADLHTHTIASKHAYSTVMENLNYGKDKGMQFIGITDHFFGVGDRLETINETSRVEKLTTLTKQGALKGSGLISGIELNFGQRVEIPKAILETPLRLGGLHSAFWGIEHQDIDALTREIKEYIDRGYINVVAHPERNLNRLAKGKYSFELTPAVKNYFKWLAEYCKNHRIFIELNEASFSTEFYDYTEMIEYWLKIASENGNPIILGSDAHICTGVGIFERSIEILNKLNYPIDFVLNCNTHLMETLFLK